MPQLLSHLVEESINWSRIIVFVEPKHENQVAAAFELAVVCLLCLSD